MPTVSFMIDDHKIISTDWDNFVSAAPSIQNRHDWSTAKIINLINQIKNHPIARLISINFMFSFHKKRVQEEFPEFDNGVICVSAAVDMLATMQEIYNYMPQEME